MTIMSVTDPKFSAYGKIVEGYDLKPLLDVLSRTPCPEDGVVYVPADPGLESLAVKDDLSARFYGGMPVQIGYCCGNNYKLDCLEYHRDSELNVALEDMVVLLAKMQSMTNFKLDTSEVEAFIIPAGTMVQFYETTLHYAPCTASGKSGFRAAVVLPRGTNTAKPDITVQSDEDKLLWACNKWLIAHPDSPEAREGAFVGLSGNNNIYTEN